MRSNDTIETIAKSDQRAQTIVVKKWNIIQAGLENGQAESQKLEKRKEKPDKTNHKIKWTK